MCNVCVGLSPYISIGWRVLSYYLLLISRKSVLSICVSVSEFLYFPLYAFVHMIKVSSHLSYNLLVIHAKLVCTHMHTQKYMICDWKLPEWGVCLSTNELRSYVEKCVCSRQADTWKWAHKDTHTNTYTNTQCYIHVYTHRYGQSWHACAHTPDEEMGPQR